MERSAIATLMVIVAAIATVGAVPGSAVRADDEDAALRSRIVGLAEPAERAGATELREHATRALSESDRLRLLGDGDAADRAHAIAEAAVQAAERHVEAHRARADRDAARARLAALEARAVAATGALERARADRARLEAAAQAAPVPAAATAPEGE
jgi:hypothetical protein